ncbi:RagB/SusD family nutrient uptake outer membrane protein [Pedobacter sp. N36a]|uniref:RagB/SusD family nutrient uptake outer membrane protein n=1 Tax=Pedobacter sp. N36a TaxID=2767996 RepID=UPI001657440E|nr:RagB/SusD family nutrient uptake outer membrane protein [Pedobacter sp. N36a]MBC8988282.1 RagB/SusD family nutrient uptake outer membrane protein [Pedobacter sp. N36a]
MKNKKYLIIALSLVLITFSGCKKSFLDRAPLDKVTLESFFKSETDLRLVTGALYGTPWFDFNDKAVIALGDALAGNLSRTNWIAYSTFAVNSSDPRINEAWRSLYKIIAYANLNIIYIEKNTDPSVSAAAKNSAIAELRFLRGSAYFYLVQYFGEVPIITDNRELAEQPQINKHLVKDVYRFVIDDMKFAAASLRSTADKGRVNAWSAKGMLAKIYLTRSGLTEEGVGTGNGLRNQALLDSAKKYAGDVCLNSGLKLLPNYADLFKIENNNNEESLFALQFIASPIAYGLGNSTQGYFAAEGRITNAGDGFGAANSPSIDIYNKYDVKDTRRKATFMQNGDLYTELLKKEGGYRVTDITPHVKKYVVGTNEDNPGQVYFLSTSSAAYMLRLADVYLIYVEAILGNNSLSADADAVRYYNLVRARAGLDVKVAPIAKADVLIDRQLELAMEGQYWFDLLREYNINASQTINKISLQNRGRLTYNAATNVRTNEPQFSIPTAESFKLPIPAADITTNPLLSQPAVAYYK